MIHAPRTPDLCPEGFVPMEQCPIKKNVVVVDLSFQPHGFGMTDAEGQTVDDVADGLNPQQEKADWLYYKSQTSLLGISY